MDNQDQLNQYGQQQEFDLVDIAAVVYRRRKTAVLTLILSVLIAIGLRFSSQQSSEVVATFATGTINNIAVMPNLGSERLLSSTYIPNNIVKYNVDSGTRLGPTSIEIVKSGKGIDGTSLVVLRSHTSTANAGLAILVMNSSLEDLASHHRVRYERFAMGIERLLEAKLLELGAIKLLASSPDHTAVDQASQLGLEATILKLQTQIATMYPSKILMPATVFPQQPKSYLLFGMYGIVSGLFLGCIVVFFLELLSKTKVRVAEIS